MRRVVGCSVGFSARRAVAVALPLAGALYLAAEERRLIVNTADGPQVVTLRDAKSPDAQSDDGVIRPPDHRAADPRVTGAPAPSTPKVQAPAADSELAAEQQAAQMPAQAPPKAKDPHTRQIIISIPDRRLALLEDGQLIKVYPVAVGKEDTPSPEGEFTIINRAVNPTWRHDGKVVGPGTNNPLGNRWMGLSAKGYGIHGTNVQSSVGKVASHGCFRLKKKDVEELYTLVQVGDAVSVRAERDELTASLFPSNAADGPKTGAEVASANPVSAAAGTDQ